MKTDTFSAPGSFSNDKWNPGDIWLSTLGVLEKPLADTKTWAEINQKVLKLAGRTVRSKNTMRDHKKLHC